MTDSIVHSNMKLLHILHTKSGTNISRIKLSSTRPRCEMKFMTVQLLNQISTLPPNNLTGVYYCTVNQPYVPYL